MDKFKKGDIIYNKSNPAILFKIISISKTQYTVKSDTTTYTTTKSYFEWKYNLILTSLLKHL